MTEHPPAPRCLEVLLLLAGVLAACGCGASPGSADAAAVDAAPPDAPPPDAPPPDAPPPDAAEPDALVPPPLRILATPASLMLVEDEVTPHEVSFKLDRWPSADVLVDLALTDPRKASLGVSQLRFTPTDFATPHLVAVMASNDDDAAPESLTLTASGPGLVSASIPVLIIDNDDQRLAVSPTNASLVEGQSMTFEMWLTLRVTTDIPVMVSFDTPAELVASPTPFMLGYPARVTITVTALDDADAVDDVHVMTISSAGNAPTVTLSISVLDDD